MVEVNFATFIGELSAAAGVIVITGPVGLYLMLGLVVVLVLIGVLGRADRRNDAQTVLAILLGRTVIPCRLARVSHDCRSRIARPNPASVEQRS